ncbi:tripartite motif-containing protein 34 isoform X3 [Fukomys damarensis]|uniref:tripartite motif-containing protein 34 isoform X3 n=1 Tax=Fukomys damarensis TaxID=885580 RepID=UPI00053FF3ED|nr:tripartite motif-containing protein 34 isoform X3 [Fukomys damarensis]
MASTVLANLEVEVICPVCLKLLTEPLSLGCGHSLCQACITVDNKDADTGSGKESGCPVCGVRYPLGSLWVNQHLADVVEKLRNAKLSTGLGKKRDLCALHGEKLQLFCEVDRKIICWLCEHSREHRGHHTLLMDEAANECQEKLQAALRRLRKEQQEAEKLKADITEDRISWKDMSGIMKWSEIWTLKKPKTPSKKLKSVFHAPDLSRMLWMFRELKDVQSYWVDFTLNPVNLNLNLVLSEDHRQVRPVPIWPFKCYNYGILASQYFSSGKHYWEIDVSYKTAWILGVYCRKRSITFAINQSTTHSKNYSRYRPQYGYWVIGLQKKLEYYAFDETSTFDPKILTLSVATPLHRVGIFLNFEAGTVSFFNITNHGSLIYKFCKCSYSQPVYPYFNPWNCPAPLTLCPPSS